jgi:BMFP domain-containing protein YqiC
LNVPFCAPESRDGDHRNRLLHEFPKLVEKGFSTCVWITREKFINQTSEVIIRARARLARPDTRYLNQYSMLVFDIIT